MATGAGLSESQKEKFEKDGFLLIEKAFSPEQCDELRKQCRHIVDTELDLSSHPGTIFATTQAQKCDDYFMTSGDRIRFFFEENVFDEKGSLKYDKMQCVNKIGHALHALDPVFMKTTHAPVVQATFRSLGFKRPVIPQSMYICKNANIGGTVRPHQDSTFLHTEPLRLTGLWIALEDAELDNGCLWFAPGTHKSVPVSQRMIRSPKGSDSNTMIIGELFEVKDEDYVPVPVKKGSMVLIDGSVVHKSKPNLSDRSRHIYTFHIIESEGVIYSKENWLQPTEALPFPPLFTSTD